MNKTLFLIGVLGLAACNQGGAVTNGNAEPSAQSAHSVSVTASPARATPKVITCHELVGGKPSPEATVYTLVGRKFYSQAPDGEKQLISAESELVNLGRSEDEEGPEDSFGSHSLEGQVLTRTVLWQRPGQDPRTAFVERYDFSNQAVLDADTGEDTCHHNVRPDGRTQQDAEWEALSGTGRGDAWSNAAE